MDSSDYMGMNVPMEAPTEEQQLAPNAEVQSKDAAAKERIQLAFKEVKAILDSEQKNVLKITDLPDLKGEELTAEIIARKRYVGLIDVLLSKLEVN